jgi:hypothetical protein
MDAMGDLREMESAFSRLIVSKNTEEQEERRERECMPQFTD